MTICMFQVLQDCLKQLDVIQEQHRQRRRSSTRSGDQENGEEEKEEEEEDTKADHVIQNLVDVAQVRKKFLL